MLNILQGCRPGTPGRLAVQSMGICGDSDISMNHMLQHAWRVAQHCLIMSCCLALQACMIHSCLAVNVMRLIRYSLHDKCAQSVAVCPCSDDPVPPAARRNAVKSQ